MQLITFQETTRNPRVSCKITLKTNALRGNNPGENSFNRFSAKFHFYTP